MKKPGWSPNEEKEREDPNNTERMLLKKENGNFSRNFFWERSNEEL